MRTSTLTHLASLPEAVRTKISVAAAQSGLPQALMEASNADRQRVDAVVRNALVSGIHAVLLAAVIGGLLTGLGVLATARRGTLCRPIRQARRRCCSARPFGSAQRQR